MATATYDLIDSTTLSSAASSITFSSIDTSTYENLTFVWNAIPGSNDIYPRMRINGITSSIYNWVSLAGTGSALQSYKGANENGGQLANNQFVAFGDIGNIIVHLFDVGNTNQERTYCSEIGRGANGTEYLWGHVTSLAAITSIQVYSTNGATFAAGTSMHLYGMVG